MNVTERALALRRIKERNRLEWRLEEAEKALDALLDLDLEEGADRVSAGVLREVIHDLRNARQLLQNASRKDEKELLA